jgi:hypothetical protein
MSKTVEPLNTGIIVKRPYEKTFYKYSISYYNEVKNGGKFIMFLPCRSVVRVDEIKENSKEYLDDTLLLRRARSEAKIDLIKTSELDVSDCCSLGVGHFETESYTCHAIPIDDLREFVTGRDDVDVNLIEPLFGLPKDYQVLVCLPKSGKEVEGRIKYYSNDDTDIILPLMHEKSKDGNQVYNQTVVLNFNSNSDNQLKHVRAKISKTYDFGNFVKPEEDFIKDAICHSLADGYNCEVSVMMTLAKKTINSFTYKSDSNKPCYISLSTNDSYTTIHFDMVSPINKCLLV